MSRVVDPAPYRAGPAGPRVAQTVHPPGSDGLWTFVFIDMIIFLVMFFMFMSERLKFVDLYTESQLSLNELFGLANTLILLTSSWMVVAAIQAARRRDAPAVCRHLGFAWILGFAFSLDKLAEYYLELRAGITPVKNSFYSFYFFITFVHFMHVAAGMLFIGYCWRRARQPLGPSVSLIGLENVGLFWHMVDVLWIFIFPMLYLVGRR